MRFDLSEIAASRRVALNEDPARCCRPLKAAERQTRSLTLTETFPEYSVLTGLADSPIEALGKLV